MVCQKECQCGQQSALIDELSYNIIKSEKSTDADFGLTNLNLLPRKCVF